MPSVQFKSHLSKAVLKPQALGHPGSEWKSPFLSVQVTPRTLSPTAQGGTGQLCLIFYSASGGEAISQLEVLEETEERTNNGWEVGEVRRLGVIGVKFTAEEQVSAGPRRSKCALRVLQQSGDVAGAAWKG